MYRQGDVLLVPMSDEPTTNFPVERENGQIILAYGERTGHSHAIADQGAALYKSLNHPLLFVTADEVTLRHEEHAPVTLPKGTYKVIIQREYEPQGSRNVLD